MAAEYGSIPLLTLLVVLNSVYLSSGLSVPFDFQHVKIITSDSHTSLKYTPFVSVVYYFKRDLPRLRAFFKELDKSAEYLDIYNTKTGIVDCSNGDEVAECNINRVEHNVYTYRDGNELLVLELETMFDVNSIMSNILQLILLHDVPIIQSPSDLHDLERRNKGKADVIFSFHKAIGTYEHRVFMEVAYAYQDRYKFGITTELNTIEALKDGNSANIKKETAVWVMYCQDLEIDSTEPCPTIRYHGKMDLPSLAIFLKAISLPRIVELEDITTIPKCREEKLNCIFLYYDAKSKDTVMQAADVLKYDVHGVAGIVTIDTEKIDLKTSHSFDGKTPSISVLLKDEDSLQFMGGRFTQANIEWFMQKALFDHDPEEEASEDPLPDSDQSVKDNDRPQYSADIGEEVESEDDEVATAVFLMRNNPMTLNHVTALTDRTFPSIIREEDLVSVLFYLPFDSRSMAFLRAYGQASESLLDKAANHSPLTRVNCFDWTDVCGQQNITSYPTVRFYGKDKEPLEYNGALDTNAVVSVIKLLQQTSPVLLTEQQEVEDFVAGRLPANTPSYSNLSILALFGTEKENGVIEFKSVANILHNTSVFAYMVGQKAEEIAKQLGQNTPCILAFRHDDPFTEAKAMTSDLSQDNIKAFIHQSLIPTLLELTVDIYPLIHRQNKPLVIIFCDTATEQETSDVKKTVGDIAASGRFPGVIFTWIHARGNNIGAQLFAQYTYHSNLPMVSLVNYKEGKVFNMDAPELNSYSVNNWLSMVLEGGVESSYTLTKGEWKPTGKGYDFLALSELEAKYEQEGTDADSLELRAAEEHGAGFNPDGSEEGEGENGEEISMDEEIRSELQELRNSRLYHHASDRKHGDERPQQVYQKVVHEKAKSADENIVSPDKNTEFRNENTRGKTKSEEASKQRNHIHGEL